MEVNQTFFNHVKAKQIGIELGEPLYLVHVPLQLPLMVKGVSPQGPLLPRKSTGL